MKKNNVSLNIYIDDSWTKLKLKKNDGTKWEDNHSIDIYRENLLDVEVGVYVTWYNDPSSSIMTHFIVSDDIPLRCMLRIGGSVNWEYVELFEEKPFPLTDMTIKWYKLDNLTPNTLYEVKLEKHKKIHKFKTMPANHSKDINVGVMSDNMNSVTSFRNEAPLGFQMLYDNNVDVIAFAGDGVHDDGTRHSNWITFWDEYSKAADSNGRLIPIVYTLGNHDGVVYNPDNTVKSLLWVGGGANESHVVFSYNFFSNLNPESYGVIDIGDYMSLLFLNSEHTRPVLGVQTSWLENILIQRQGKIIFPFMHVGGYPGFYDYNSNPSLDIRNYWYPLMLQYGVKVTASGHEHVSLVTKKVLGDNEDFDGLIHVGQGHGMGNVTRPTNNSTAWYIDYFSDTTKSLPILTFRNNGSILVRHVGLDGSTLFSKEVE